MRALLALVVAAPACAWQDGEPFATVDVSVDARFVERADRGGAWQRLASDYELAIASGAAQLGALRLVEVSGGAAAFDPSDPPPGYALCHGGHCHADDGRLVAYEDIAAELAGGAGPRPVLTLAVGAVVLVPGSRHPLACEGPCDLPRAEVRRVELAVDELHLAGRVRDTRSPPRLDGERAWTLTLARAGAAPLTGRIDLPLDRGHPPAVTLDVGFAPSAILLDGVDFERVVDGGALEADRSSRAAVELALGELSLDLAIHRAAL